MSDIPPEQQEKNTAKLKEMLKEYIVSCEDAGDSRNTADNNAKIPKLQSSDEGGESK